MEDLHCPYCGEPLETFVDPGGASRQSYIEDCAVCCRPIRFDAWLEEDDDEFRVIATREP